MGSQVCGQRERKTSKFRKADGKKSEKRKKKKQNAIKLLPRLFIRNSEDNNKVFL